MKLKPDGVNGISSESSCGSEGKESFKNLKPAGRHLQPANPHLHAALGELGWHVGRRLADGHVPLPRERTIAKGSRCLKGKARHKHRVPRTTATTAVSQVSDCSLLWQRAVDELALWQANLARSPNILHLFLRTNTTFNMATPVRDPVTNVQPRSDVLTDTSLFPSTDSSRSRPMYVVPVVCCPLATNRPVNTLEPKLTLRPAGVHERYWKCRVLRPRKDGDMECRHYRTLNC